MATDVQVPALGESITEGTLAQWLKKPGDAVAADEPIASLETDKVTVEVPSPVAGVLAEQLVKEGDTVAVGALIARINEGAAAAASPATEAADRATPIPRARARPRLLRGDDHAPRRRRRRKPRPKRRPSDTITTLSPAVRRAVLEHHVDPSKIRGSGKDGRLTKDDVIAAAEAQKAAPAQPAPRRKPAPGARAPAPVRDEPGLRRGTARKSASRCRGCARPSRRG